MGERWVMFDMVEVVRYLSSGVVKARLAEMLRGWTRPRRPAILLSIDAETPLAAVLGEDDLGAAFKDTPIIDVESTGRNAPRSLLVLVYDGRETMGFRIADPGWHELPMPAPASDRANDAPARRVGGPGMAPSTAPDEAGQGNASQWRSLGGVQRAPVAPSSSDSAKPLLQLPPGSQKSSGGPTGTSLDLDAPWAI